MRETQGWGGKLRWAEGESEAAVHAAGWEPRWLSVEVSFIHFFKQFKNPHLRTVSLLMDGQQEKLPATIFNCGTSGKNIILF